jgi:DNA-binding XRE family transcriptional regulator
LPEGEYEVDWQELVERFGWNSRRRQLLDGLAEAIELLAAAGCRRLWLNGSFVTAKEEPADFDACWDPSGVDLDALDPIFMDFSQGRAAQKRRFGGELLPNVIESRSGLSFSEFFPQRAGYRTKGDRCDHDRRTTMIMNEVQYRATKAHLERLEEAAANLEGKLAQEGRNKLLELELAAVRSQAGDLRAEIAEYEQLRSGAVSSLEADSLADLATLLIKARIARGWTQRQLAEALGVAEQQVQRYESTEYRSASLARICDVAAALDISITERAVLGKPDAA